MREADKNNQLAKLRNDYAGLSATYTKINNDLAVKNNELAAENNKLAQSLAACAVATEKSTKNAGRQTSYILVFTITTVFYLPIGFVTVSPTAL